MTPRIVREAPAPSWRFPLPGPCLAFCLGKLLTTHVACCRRSPVDPPWGSPLSRALSPKTPPRRRTAHTSRACLVAPAPAGRCHPRRERPPVAIGCACPFFAPPSAAVPVPRASPAGARRDRPACGALTSSSGPLWSAAGAPPPHAAYWRPCFPHPTAPLP